MKKVIGYTCEFYIDSPARNIQFEPMGTFTESAVEFEHFVDSLALNKEDRKRLFKLTRNLLDRTVENAFLQFVGE